MVLTTKVICLLSIVVLVVAYNTVEATPDDAEEVQTNLTLHKRDDDTDALSMIGLISISINSLV